MYLLVIYYSTIIIDTTLAFKLFMPKPFIARDTFASRAKKEGFLARSAYKLQEILSRFPVIEPGDTVLDLGAMPGSWLQVLSQAVDEDGLVAGLDLEPIVFSASNIRSFQGDIFSPASEHFIAGLSPFDAILSDMAPKTSGIRVRDQALSLALVERVFALAGRYLKKNGSVIAKIFVSPDMRQLLPTIKKDYRSVQLFKPRASRDRSYETYIIARGKLTK